MSMPKICRKNPFTNEISDDIFSDAFEQLVNVLGEEWIRTAKNNPISILFSRDDILATTELFTLATSVKTMIKIDKEWTNHQVQVIKGANENNIHGSIFELIALALLADDKYILKPTSIGYPGIDAKVIFPDGGRTHLSLKCFYKSSHQTIFEDKSKEFEHYIIQRCLSARVTNIELRVIFLSYPADYVWSELKTSFAQIIIDSIEGPKVYSVNNNTAIYINRIPGNFNLDPEYLSHSLLCISPYHKNEFSNMLSKIEDACSNLDKHNKEKDIKIANAIFMHIHEASTFLSCKEYISEYFLNNPNKQIGYILLYKPAYVINNTDNTSYINHCISIVESAEHIRWKNQHPDNIINITIPIGTYTFEDVKLILLSNENISINNTYIYQSGTIYTKVLLENGSGDIKKLAAGVLQHVVLHLPNGEKVLLKGKFPSQDKLLIL